MCHVSLLPPRKRFSISISQEKIGIVIQDPSLKRASLYLSWPPRYYITFHTHPTPTSSQIYVSLCSPFQIIDGYFLSIFLYINASTYPSSLAHKCQYALRLSEFSFPPHPMFPPKLSLMLHESSAIAWKNWREIKPRRCNSGPCTSPTTEMSLYTPSFTATSLC